MFEEFNVESVFTVNNMAVSLRGVQLKPSGSRRGGAVSSRGHYRNTISGKG